MAASQPLSPHSLSPLAPTSYPDIPSIDGVRFATAQAGIRYQNRQDVFLALLDEGTTVAGVFTRSKCPSATVDWCRTHLTQAHGARALLVNSGNANAFTGQKGVESVQLSADIVAKAIGCTPEQVFLASTGVIGEPLDARKFAPVMDGLVRDAKAGNWLDAAKAIMTTDTFPKVAMRQVTLDGQLITLAGIAKGAGMIAPDMATMLSFIFTDAAIDTAVLQNLISKGADKSFNCMSVDGDTSTSDTLIAFATGKASAVAPITSLQDPRLKSLRRAMDSLLIELAQMVAKDGEGARKFVTIDVEGAASARAAKKIAFSIANCPLVKTAIAGEDANWGRVVMAVGKAGEKAERDKLEIRFGSQVLAQKGERVASYDEAIVSEYMRGQNIVITVNLHLGRGKARVWTCDLTKEYVAINGDYRS